MVSIDQYYFDFSFWKCLRCFQAEDRDGLKVLTDIVKSTLKLIDVNFNQNLVKAHILLIIDFLEDKTPENQERDELLGTLEDIQSSLNVLQKFYETNDEVNECIRKSLFYNYVAIVQIHSPSSSDKTFNEIIPNTIKKMKTVVNMEDVQEKKTLALFEIVTKENAQPLRKSGYPKMLDTVVKDLVSKLAFTFEPPEIIGIFEKHLNEKNKKISEIQETFDKRSTAVRPMEVLDHIFLSLGGDPNLSDEALMKKAEKIREEVRVRLEQQKNEMNETCECDNSELDRNSDTFKLRQLKSIQPRRSLLDFRRSRKPPSHDRALKSKWTEEEENEFIRKTFEIGEGQWLQIKTDLKSLRSTMQLKDKWRNISQKRKKAIKKELGR